MLALGFIATSEESLSNAFLRARLEPKLQMRKAEHALV